MNYPLMKTASSRSSRRSSTGFSLVEVTLALGITAFCLTVLMALMPIGLSTFRSSIETSLRADLMRRIAGDLRQTPFSEVKAREYYFTDTGIPADESQDANKRFFKVSCQIILQPALLKDQTGNPYVNNSVKVAQIDYYTLQDQMQQVAPSYTDYIYIANNGL